MRFFRREVVCLRTAYATDKLLFTIIKIYIATTF